MMERHNNGEKKHSDISIEYLSVSSYQSISYDSFGTEYTLFFYKNIFYKNIEAEICEILRIF